MREEGQFEGITVRMYNSPVGWDGARVVEHGNGSEIGRLMVLNANVSTLLSIERFDLTVRAHGLQEFVLSSKPSLLASGVPEAIVEVWARNALWEAQDPRKKIVLKWAFSWATKADYFSTSP